jgi:hypothetical protein
VIVNAKVAVALCAGVLESVTLIVSGVAAMATVGVPAITPVETFKVNKAGSVPEIKCHV